MSFHSSPIYTSVIATFALTLVNLLCLFVSSSFSQYHRKFQGETEMALRWLLHSACHVLGHPEDNSEVKGTQTGNYSNAEVKKSLKGSSLQISAANPSGFQMPLHYPRYKKYDYENMEEWKVDLLLKEYGLSFKGSLDEKRAFAMGAFLWPNQY